jgi:hypothetical protein
LELFELEPPEVDVSIDISLEFQAYASRAMTDVTVSETPIFNEEFPLDIQLLVRPGFAIRNMIHEAANAGETVLQQADEIDVLGDLAHALEVIPVTIDLAAPVRDMVTLSIVVPGFDGRELDEIYVPPLDFASFTVPLDLAISTLGPRGHPERDLSWAISPLDDRFLDLVPVSPLKALECRREQLPDDMDLEDTTIAAPVIVGPPIICQSLKAFVRAEILQDTLVMPDGSELFGPDLIPGFNFAIDSMVAVLVAPFKSISVCDVPTGLGLEPVVIEPTVEVCLPDWTAAITEKPVGGVVSELQRFDLSMDLRIILAPVPLASSLVCQIEFDPFVDIDVEDLNLDSALEDCL